MTVIGHGTLKENLLSRPSHSSIWRILSTAPTIRIPTDERKIRIFALSSNSLLFKTRSLFQGGKKRNNLINIDLICYIIYINIKKAFVEQDSNAHDILTSILGDKHTSSLNYAYTIRSVSHSRLILRLSVTFVKKICRVSVNTYSTTCIRIFLFNYFFLPGRRRWFFEATFIYVKEISFKSFKELCLFARVSRRCKVWEINSKGRS